MLLIDILANIVDLVIDAALTAITFSLGVPANETQILSCSVDYSMQYVSLMLLVCVTDGLSDICIQCFGFSYFPLTVFTFGCGVWRGRSGFVRLS